jgi:diguanylate cyclase (GGDEF)-like protein
MASAVFLVDLDDFHVLNNGLGRDLGDTILKVVAKRLEATAKDSTVCTSCEGDRFLVLVSNAQEQPPVDAIADRLIEAVRAPMQFNDDGAPPLVISASVGSVLDDGSSVSELVRRADIALSQAKTDRLNPHVSFTPEIGDAALTTARLEIDLREALDTEQLFLTYLPGVDITTGRLTSAEALLRWHHPERGVVTAQEFLPRLEHSGTIVEVGAWVLREACMQAAIWQRRSMPIEIHVNLSARQLGAGSLLEVLRETLTMSMLKPERLVLDIQESTVSDDTARIAEQLQAFKALGVRIAITNFGAAYGVLGQLERLPVDIVELDRSLIAGLGERASAAALVRTLVEIANGLGLKTFATGVEREQQASELREAGCAGALGHLYSQPVDADELATLFSTSAALARGDSPAGHRPEDY